MLKEDNAASQFWPMARIAAVHAGADGVISLKTQNGKTKQAVSLICVPPISSDYGVYFLLLFSLFSFVHFVLRFVFCIIFILYASSYFDFDLFDVRFVKM